VGFIWRLRLFGVFEALDYVTDINPVDHSRWSVSAGARSVHFSYSLGNHKRVRGGLKRTLKDLGFRQDALAEDFPSCSHWEVSKKIQRLLAPDWAVEVLFFPEHWLYDISVPPGTRLRFEHALLKTGWKQAQTLVSSIDAADFLESWSKTRAGKRLPEERQLGLLGYELMAIDRGLKPCLIDIRQILGTNLEYKFSQLYPLHEAFSFLLLLAANLKVDEYVTILLPGWLEPGIRSGFCSLFFGDLEQQPHPDTRKTFMRRLTKTFSGGDNRRNKGSEHEKLRMIDQGSLIFIQGVNRARNDVSDLSKFILRLQDSLDKFNKQAAASLEWYQQKYHHEFDPNTLNGFTLIEETLAVEARSKIASLQTRRSALGFGLRWFIQFSTRQDLDGF